uniref:Uncharacterized protein n=1 Tax=Octopus bimaculoides TaxID=37653 RepID=A0A0L8H8E4_OCTBM
MKLQHQEILQQGATNEQHESKSGKMPKQVSSKVASKGRSQYPRVWQGQVKLTKLKTVVAFSKKRPKTKKGTKKLED